MVDTSTDAVTKLMDGVTPGPWAGDPRFSTIVAGEKCIAEVFTSDADASFIAAARDLVPALLAERDALKKERDEAMEGWHVIHPNITVQDAAKVEHVAFSLWKAEAERAAPNVARNRTPEMFLGELESTRAKWLSLADAALRAIAEGK